MEKKQSFNFAKPEADQQKGLPNPPAHIQHKLDKGFPNSITNLVICIKISITSCEPERNFSKLSITTNFKPSHRGKTYLSILFTENGITNLLSVKRLSELSR